MAPFAEPEGSVVVLMLMRGTPLWLPLVGLESEARVSCDRAGEGSASRWPWEVFMARELVAAIFHHVRQPASRRD